MLLLAVARDDFVTTPSLPAVASKTHQRGTIDRGAWLATATKHMLPRRAMSQCAKAAIPNASITDETEPSMASVGA